MATSIPAPVNPRILVWLRKRASLELRVAAKKTGVDPEKLEAWESGEEIPTLAKLRKMAEVYKSPLEVFLLDEIPHDFTPMRDHRRLPSGEIPHESPELAYHVRRTRERREVALGLMAADADRLGLEASLQDDPVAVARRARERLGITMPQQTRWRSSEEALKHWIRAIEALDILVFQTTGVEVLEMRGLSVAEYPLPAILLNGKDSDNARIFTLMHELAHLMLRDGGICDYSEGERTEVFCNQVAAEILIPQGSLLQHPLLHGKDSVVRWTDEDISILADSFHVSREAMVRRLVTLGRASETFYKEKREQYLLEYAAAAERKKQKQRDRPPIIPEYRKALKRNGLPYVRAVLTAMHQRRVTVRDASDFLGIKLKHFPALEKAVWHAQGR